MASFRVPAAYEMRTCHLHANLLLVWLYSHSWLAKPLVESFLTKGFGGPADLFTISGVVNGLVYVVFSSCFDADLLQEKLFYSSSELILFTSVSVEDVGDANGCCLLVTPERMMFEVQGDL
jgi:hypothetical protein